MTPADYADYRRKENLLKYKNIKCALCLRYLRNLRENRVPVDYAHKRRKDIFNFKISNKKSALYLRH